MLWLGFIYCTFRYESEFDAFTGASTEVSIVTSDYSELSSPVDRTVNPSYEQIEEMVGKAIELQGGLDWVIEKGDVVKIKENLVGGSSGSGDGENTDVRVVKSFDNEYRNADTHEYTWHLDNNWGTRLTEGTYVCILRVGKQSRTTKLVIESIVRSDF